MKQKKIDDDRLLEMFHAGTLQKDIAVHFGVSPVAVSKRLKRLLPDPLMNHDLTEQQKRFVIEKGKGKNNTQAALIAYECSSLESAKVIGSQLMADPDIKIAISDLMASEGLTRRYRIQRLRNHVDNRDPHVSLKGLDLSFRLDGSYAPEKHVNLNLDYGTLTKEIQELERQIAAFEGKNTEVLGNGN